MKTYYKATRGLEIERLHTAESTMRALCSEQGLLLREGQNLVAINNELARTGLYIPLVLPMGGVIFEHVPASSEKVRDWLNKTRLCHSGGQIRSRKPILHQQIYALLHHYFYWIVRSMLVLGSRPTYEDRTKLLTHGSLWAIWFPAH